MEKSSTVANANATSFLRQRYIKAIIIMGKPDTSIACWNVDRYEYNRIFKAHVSRIQKNQLTQNKSKTR